MVPFSNERRTMFLTHRDLEKIEWALNIERVKFKFGTIHIIRDTFFADIFSPKYIIYGRENPLDY